MTAYRIPAAIPATDRKPPVSPPSAMTQRTNAQAAGDSKLQRYYFAALLFLCPITSILLTPAQGTTPATMLLWIAPVILVGTGSRYINIMVTILAFALLYTAYLALGISARMFSAPDFTRAILISKDMYSEVLYASNITQGIYLMSSILFAALVYNYYREYFFRYLMYGLIALCLYGIYEFFFYAATGIKGDFLSNRVYGEGAVAGAAGEFINGSSFQYSTILGSGFMRLKSLTGEPSMFAMTVTPFTLYAYCKKWNKTTALLGFSLALSQSSTAIIGIITGIIAINLARRGKFLPYFLIGLVMLAGLYLTHDGINKALNVLIFEKMDSFSGQDRMTTMLNQFAIIFDGNIVRMLFGVGFGTVRSPDMISTLAANVGLIGLLAYTALILYPVFALQWNENNLAIKVALISLFVMQMATVSEFSYFPPWFLIALGFVRIKQQNPHSPSHQP